MGLVADQQSNDYQWLHSSNWNLYLVPDTILIYCTTTPRNWIHQKYTLTSNHMILS